MPKVPVLHSKKGYVEEREREREKKMENVWRREGGKKDVKTRRNG